MKGTKLIHIVIAVMLILLSLAIFQWSRLSTNAPPVSQSSLVTAAPAELPALPQNELYNLNTSPSFSKELPPFVESPGESNPEPKEQGKTGKPML